ncbi:DHH family phosphoesterase [Salinigranum rubrum]|uniref:DHH family phosphoesterase n=1 Tax=Salinigranum rubrum TaxID=755307 RepID=A0A2I8VRS2_9EURY|nr:DHH family phosphoesterase [Salinigranum rubrum]AUV83899.1 DHH family phosphoesterase [Salinigranum rubrum]
MSRPSRLVLGWSPVARAVVRSVRSRRGTLSVVAEARSRVESLRDEGVDATMGDPTDPETYPSDVTTVVVAGADSDQNLDAARVARERFPDALVVAYAGSNPSDETLAALGEVADRVVDPHESAAGAFLDTATGATVTRVTRLLRVLRGIDGTLAVVMHDNPDPDAIASALALVRIADAVGVDAVPCYFGEVSHQENRALINLLDLSLTNLEPGTTMDEYGGIALVDHSRPGVNDGLPSDTRVDVAIDHHPPRAPVEARCLDLRSGVGATSTLLTEYLRRLRIDPDRTLATALLFGIRVDTNDFSREVSDADFEAAAFLCPHVDHSALDRIEEPSMGPEVLDLLARAIRNRAVRGDALATNVGEISDRDALAQAADRLLDMEGVRLTLVYGYRDDTVYASGRARGTDVDLGETLRDAFGSIGSAGGHADMAGAQIDLGVWKEAYVEGAEQFEDLVTEVISARFFETLETAPASLLGGAGELGFEYPFEG